MASLTARAIDKLSVREIWEKGVLDAPLPPQTLNRLYNKITLQNLYSENLLTSDMDLDLFAFALSVSFPDLLWRYNRYIFPEESPFGEEDVIETTLEEYQLERKVALQDLLNDLLLFLDNLDHPQNYEDSIFVISKLEDDLWKLLNIVLDPTSENAPTHVFILDSLDKVLGTIYENNKVFIEEGVAITLNRPLEHTLASLTPIILKSFNAIRTVLDIETEELWEMLKTGESVLTGDFQLSINELKRHNRVTVMGDYLYIIIVSDEGTKFTSFNRKEGLALLTSFYIPGNNSKFTDIRLLYS